MDEEKSIANIFSLMESTSRIGRELISKIFIAEKVEHKGNPKFSHFQILEAIYNNDGITQNDLCELLFKNKIYISKCLKFFESKKLVTKNFINKEDKVLTGYSITERGMVSYKAGIILINELERKIVAKSSEDDVEKTTLCLGNLNKIITNISETLDLTLPKIEEDWEEEI